MLNRSSGGASVTASVGTRLVVNITVPCDSGWVVERVSLQTGAVVVSANWLQYMLATPGTAIWMDELVLAEVR